MNSAPSRRAGWLRRCLNRRVVPILGALVIGGVAPAAASAYWDFTGYLNAGQKYAESQGGTSGYWLIRLSRNNCGASPWLHNRNGNWEWFGFPCTDSDSTTSYPLSTYSGSEAWADSGITTWVNVRIDSTV
jgi:hypothetical protein